MSSVHDVLQAVTLAQANPPAHAVGVPATQVPEPLHVLRVSFPLLQAGVPQAVADG